MKATGGIIIDTQIMRGLKSRTKATKSGEVMKLEDSLRKSTSLYEVEKGRTDPDGIDFRSRRYVKYVCGVYVYLYV